MIEVKIPETKLYSASPININQNSYTQTYTDGSQTITLNSDVYLFGYFEILRVERLLLQNLEYNLETLKNMLEGIDIPSRDLALSIIESKTKYLGRILRLKATDTTGFSSYLIIQEYFKDNFGKI